MARGLLSVTVLALVGCGTGVGVGPSPACSDTPQSVERALHTAPARVLLVDGTPISACVERAHDDGQLQSVGSVLTTVADDLSSRAASNPDAAVQLGYLVGATRRGARHVNGVAAELVRRLEQDASGPSAPALGAGLRAGEAGG